MRDWSAVERVGFRFATLVTLLLIAPFPAGFVPFGGHLERAVDALWVRAVAWYAETVLGIAAPPHVFTGSGDTHWHFVQLALIASLATLGTIAWSWFDRRRTSYARLASALAVLVRYFLASMMLLYGIAKVFPMQFPPLWLGRYDATLGEMSPMGLLWTFMGHSQPYTIIAGGAEVLAGLLLLSRRTAVLGALLAAVVMTQVVLLNLCYDVPVKLFSMQLLAYALALAAPHARRLIGAALGHPTAGVAPRMRSTPARERLRLVAKVALLASFAISGVGYARFALAQRPPPSALHGMWRVERQLRDGADVPPLFTDDTRWRKLIVHEYGATLRYATDRRVHYRVQLHEAMHTLVLTAPAGLFRVTFTYARPAEDRLVLDGTLAGHQVHLELALEPPPPLATRGFHWIQDEPYNR